MVGMGAEGHICALFPNSPALTSSRLSVAVDRPDGMKGITMTPRALLMAKKIYIVERGTEKADAVRRAMNGDEPASTVPVRVLAEHPDVTFLIDEPAASLL
jgi:6-phosphogluconolactonase/glucosamine-6-phosphate isomerase/deaminase